MTDRTPEQEQTAERSAERSAWAARLGTRAVRRVLKENRERGIPSAFEFRGHLVFEMPDGSLTTDNPFTARPEAPGAR